MNQIKLLFEISYSKTDLCEESLFISTNVLWMKYGLIIYRLINKKYNFCFILYFFRRTAQAAQGCMENGWKYDFCHYYFFVLIPFLGYTFFFCKRTWKRLVSWNALCTSSLFSFILCLQKLRYGWSQ